MFGVATFMPWGGILAAQRLTIFSGIIRIAQEERRRGAVLGIKLADVVGRFFFVGASDARH
jgi:predicted hotdog family 3-hydroxylacyl-ACP dehydratase